MCLPAVLKRRRDHPVREKSPLARAGLAVNHKREFFVDINLIFFSLAYIFP
jgi:hypothetical protein